MQKGNGSKVIDISFSISSLQQHAWTTVNIRQPGTRFVFSAKIGDYMKCSGMWLVSIPVEYSEKHPASQHEQLGTRDV